MSEKVLHIIGGGIAGTITALAWQNKFDKIYLYEKENSFFQYASSRNAAILRSYESDVCISNIVKLSLLEFYKLNEIEKNIISLCGLWLHPHEVDYYLDDFISFMQENKFEYEGKFLELLTPQKKNLHDIVTENSHADLANKEGVFISGNGIIHLDHLLLYFQEKLDELQKSQKLIIYYNSQVERFVLSNNTIEYLALKKKRHSTLQYQEISQGDVIVEATGSWAGGEIRQEYSENSVSLNEAEALNWKPPLTAYKRHLYNLKINNSNHKKIKPVVWDETNGFYLKPQQDGYLATNCDETATTANDYLINIDHQQVFESQLKDNYSFLKDAKVTESRACLRTFALDERPIIGFDPYVKNMFWVAGLGGKGMSMSLGLIKWMKKLTLENEDDFPKNPFSCYRFI